MRVVIDGSPLSLGGGQTGVGVWTAGLVRALAAKTDWELFLLQFKERPILGELPAKIIEVGYTTRSFRLARLLSIQPDLTRFTGPTDAVIGSAYIPWKSRGALEIPVIYDLAFMRFPETVSRMNRRYLKAMIPRAVRSAPIVITISSSVRDELVARLGIDPSAIVITPPPIEPMERQVETASQAQTPYFLFVGGMEPRKNFNRVAEAFETVKGRTAARLVVVGNEGRRWDRSQSQQDGVEFLGYVPKERLATLYSNATALVYPSLYEGFGIPILEAMSVGCPVITSHQGSPADLSGGAAVLVDPTQTGAIADAMLKVLEDPELRDDLAQKGRGRAAIYPWAKSTDELIERLEETTKGRRGSEQ